MQKNLNNLYILLATAGVMSVLVMDEEVLVLGCWVVFVALAYTYGSSVLNEIFNERRAKFSENILSSYIFKETAIKTLINYHTIQFSVISEIIQLCDFSKSEISRILGQRRDNFKLIIASQIEQKLSILADKEGALASQVQVSIEKTVSENVLSLFKSKEKNVNTLKEKILKESMSKFENISKV